VNSDYPVVARRARHRCEYCRAPEAVFNFPFEVEHVIPRSAGGSDETSNLALACRSCNLRKGTQTGLYNPRDHRWDEHFAANPATFEVEGLTPIGRETVARLDMHNAAQLTAREAWARLGLYP
jgi:hypothetical protein